MWDSIKRTNTGLPKTDKRKAHKNIRRNDSLKFLMLIKKYQPKYPEKLPTHMNSKYDKHRNPQTFSENSQSQR